MRLIKRYGEHRVTTVRSLPGRSRRGLRGRIRRRVWTRVVIRWNTGRRWMTGMTAVSMKLLHSFVKRIHLFLLVRGEMLFHVQNSLIEYCLHVSPVFFSQRAERYGGAISNPLDSLSLSIRKLNLTGQVDQEHILEERTFSGHDLGDPMP